MKVATDEGTRKMVPGSGAWLFIAALVGALANFHPHAIGWDPALYTWAIEANLMPHAPYLGYVAVGEALSLLLPTAFGLALFSSVAHIAAVFGLCRAVRAMDPRPAGESTALIAALLYAGLPIVQRQAGLQEVYAPATACALWSLAWLYEGRLWRSGLCFAVGASLWFGLLLALPAFGVRLLREREGRTNRVLAWCLPNAIVGVVCLLVLRRLFQPYVGRGLEFRDWFRGIGISRQVHSLGEWGDSLAREFGALFDTHIVGAPFILGSLAVVGLLALARRPNRALVPWLGLGAIYLLFESIVGRNLDRGLYAAYLGAPLSVLAALALGWPGELVRSPQSRRVFGTLARLLALALLVFGTVVSRRSFPRAELAAFEVTQHVAANRWIAEHLPEDVYVVQPTDVGNANLPPSLHHRRPIFVYRGGWYVLDPFGPRVPVHPAFFRGLDGERLHALAAGSQVIAHDRALGEFFPGIAFEPLGVPGAPAELLLLRNRDG